MVQKLLAEFIGTFFLVLAVLLCINGPAVGWIVPFAIGATLMTMVYIMGSVSGAHLNPAVSLGIFVRGGFAAVGLVQYWIAQFLGAAAAAGVVILSMPASSAVTAALVGEAGRRPHGPAANPGVSLAGVITLEAIWTFLLVMVVLEVATRKATSGNKYYGAAIGGTVTLGAIIVGPYSGGAFNPAVGSTALLNGGFPTDLVAYLVGPLLGGLFAGLAFRVLRPSDRIA